MPNHAIPASPAPQSWPVFSFSHLPALASRIFIHFLSLSCQTGNMDSRRAFSDEEAHTPIISEPTAAKTHTLNSVTEVYPISPPCDDPPNRRADTDRAATEGHSSPLTGTEALKTIMSREGWDKFGFVLFRTYYREEALWERFVERYNMILREELSSAQSADGSDDLLRRVQIEIVSDDAMANKIPAHIALAYRILSDIDPGLKTKMCLIVDKESMESIAVESSHSIPFVKAVDVVLGADAESAFPHVIKVAISSLLARFYPALANCDTVWEIAPGNDEIWLDWPSSADDVLREQ
ncbi:hypothetical protein BJX64DRAFT_41435 [Aspergillus heterothallicus]